MMRRLTVTITREPGAIPRGAMTNPELVYETVRDLAAAPQEHFEVLHLDVKHRLLARQTIAIGTLDRALIHPRDVFTGALLHGSAGIVLVHNHPSGDPEPSSEDTELTRQLLEGAKLLGVSILDHVIVGVDGFVSLARRGLMEWPAAAEAMAAEPGGSR